MDKAQEAQKADLVPRVSEVGPGGVNVAGGTTLGLAHVSLQHQTAGGLSALLEPTDAACGQGGQLPLDQRCPPMPLPTPRPSTQLPTHAYSWCSVITQGMILLPTWEGGAETCTGAPIPAPLSIPLGFLLLSEPHPTHNPHSWWEALPTPPPTLLQAPRPPGPGLASCPTSQTLRAPHAVVSGPWSPLSASALCLDRARGHAEPPSPSSPPLPGPPLTHSNLGTFSLHELTSPWGHGLRGGGSALPFRRGWGGAAGWGRKADSPQSLHP